MSKRASGVKTPKKTVVIKDLPASDGTTPSVKGGFLGGIGSVVKSIAKVALPTAG